MVTAEKLMELCKVAKKAAEAAVAVTVEGEVEEVRCIDVLHQLRKSSITCQLLVSAQVVKLLQPLTNHPRKKIQDFASDLIVSWRSMFFEQLKKDVKSGSYAQSVKIGPVVETANAKKVNKRTFEKILNAETVKVQNIDQDGTQASNKVLKSSQQVKSSTERTNSMENVKIEKVIREERHAFGIAPLRSMLKCSDTFREIVREKLYDALSKVSTEADEEIRDEVNASDPIGVAISVESAMFEKWGRSNGTYKVKYRCILYNINDPKNPDFRRKVLLEHVKPDAVVNMTSKEMFSNKMQHCYQQYLKVRALVREGNRRYPIDSLSDEIKCRQCGRQKTTYIVAFSESVNCPKHICDNCRQHV